MKHDYLLGVIIPVFGHFDYAALAAETAVTKSATLARAFVIDDGSEGGMAQMQNLYYRFDEHVPGRVRLYRYEANRGLTWAWNEGLRLARGVGCTHVCCANSDVLFSAAWDLPLIAALEDPQLALVGPVSNAPGTETAQDVRKHFPGAYKVDDDQDKIDAAGKSLGRHHGNKVCESKVNGFCMLAKTATWFANAYDEVHAFKPRNDFNSTGQPNADPLNTLQEYELQGRLHASGLKTGFCPGSFVFHYRSVTRGDKFKRGGWYRKAGP